MAHCELILGGARSGKSSLAQKRAASLTNGSNIIYIATATAGDSEMAARIQHHKQNRPTEWQVVEQPIYLADTITQHDKPNTVILVDCLTLWLTNLLCNANTSLLAQQKNALLSVLLQPQGNIILVSNETGLGVIPADPLSRQFVDEAGWLHQQIAQQANRVTYCIAGLEHSLKNE